RGEAIRCLAESGFLGIALDFSPDATVMAHETLRRAAGPLRASGVLGFATKLPLASGSVGVVLLLDVVEHLAAVDLWRALGEAKRVLAPGGALVVHTSPNLWYYRFGYPLYRALERLRGHELPKDPRDRNPWLKPMHVNEQTPRTLRRSLRAAGFDVRRLLLRPADPAPGEPDRRLRRLLGWVAGLPGLRNVLCNDIFAVACPESRR
ncbi:MAG: methyltransferase domain-containing protein, partial [Deltaproteobacteria bacterium]|nr:methyltransferase domain-containing protein [Deltaproteobacteria bacterium]